MQVAAGVPTPTPTPPGPSASGKAAAWLTKYKWPALAGAGIIGVALYERSKNSSSASASPTSQAADGTAVSPSSADNGMTYGYSSTDLDQYNALAGAISDLNDQISAGSAATSAGTTTGGTYTPTTGEQLVGVGYGAPGGSSSNPYGDYADPIATANGSYLYVTTPAQLGAIKAAGGTAYFQSAPGVFTPVPAKGFGPGTPSTPIFQKTG